MVNYYSISNRWLNLKSNVKRTAGDMKSRARNSFRKATNKVIRWTKYHLYTSLSLKGISQLKLPPSPTPHLLLSNKPPTDEEIPLVLDMISQAEVEVERLAEVLWLRRNSGAATIWVNLTEFNLERAKDVAIKHKATLSIIRRIPPDILREIFAFSTTGYVYGPMGSRRFFRGTLSIPLAQSGVCRFWRETALSTPTLWNRLPSIDLEQNYSKKPSFLRFLTEYLDQRCGEAPLDIHLVTRVWQIGPNVTVHPAILILVSRSMKWRTAIFNNVRFKPLSFSAVKGRLPLLETLAMSFPPRRFTHIPMSVDVFQDAPRLRRVIISRTDTTSILLPHHQLVHYQEEDCEPSQCRDLSKLSHCLQTLEIREFRASTVTGPSTTLNSLTTLRLQLLAWEGRCALLESLTLPALKELAIFFVFDDEVHANVMTSVLSLISRSSSGKPSTIEMLHVRSGFMRVGEMTSLFRSAPRITHLNIDIPPLEDLARLTHTEGPNVLAPMLQVCTFYSNGMIYKDHAILCHQLATSRCDLPDSTVSDAVATVQRLRGLYIEYHQCAPEVQQSILHGWRESENSSALKTHRQHLIDYLYKRVLVPATFKMSAAEYYAHSILSTLSSIETMAFAEDVYVSGILGTLYHLINQFYTGKGEQHAIWKKCQIILDKWKPVFAASFDDFHWACNIHNMVYYISKSNPIRKSSDDMIIRLVSGQLHNDDIPQLDQTWPPYNWS